MPGCARLPVVCRELSCLNMTPSEAVMAGNVKFSAEGMADEAPAASSSGSSSRPQAAAAVAGKEAAAGTAA